MTVRVVGPKDKYDKASVINTTSRSNNWSRGLSPFLLGPIRLYEGAGLYQSKNFENVWQYAKTYIDQVDEENNPTPEYFKWAQAGWRSERASRYPKGKGARPLYHWWAGEKLGLIEARKKIYVPLYGRAVAKTKAFALLKEEYQKKKSITLWDFDGYDYRAQGMTIQDAVNNPNRSLGHAFVIAHLLQKMFPEYQEKVIPKPEPEMSFEDSLKIF